MKLAIGIRLQNLRAPESMGVVSDTLFVNCYWPKLDFPTRIFAPGSSGIRVMGSAPRNVWFPDDIIFEPFRPDALYPAERAVKTAFPYRVGLVNLSPQESQVWWDAYQTAVMALPNTSTVIETQRGTNCLRHYEETARRSVTLEQDSVTTLPDGSKSILKAGSVLEKIEYEEFVADLEPIESERAALGTPDVIAALYQDKFSIGAFRHVGMRNPDGSLMTLDDWKLARV